MSFERGLRFEDGISTVSAVIPLCFRGRNSDSSSKGATARRSVGICIETSPCMSSTASFLFAFV